MSNLAELSSINKSFNKIKVLRDVSLKLVSSQQYVIQGASGSGKSTLLYILGGLDGPDSGSVKIEGHDISSFGDEELSRYRNQYLGFVFQFHFLLGSMNCLDNMLLPARIGGLLSSEVKKRVLDLADHLSISHCLKKYPFELSGGEQQRVNIVRALSLRPKLLLCDEPTGNLDSHNSDVVISLLKNLCYELKSTLLLVTHDSNVAGQFDHHIWMRDGKIVEAPLLSAPNL